LESPIQFVDQDYGKRPKDILDTWHVDHAGPLVKSHGCTQILVIVDAFSKYCRMKPEDSMRALFSVFKKLGKPRPIIADRGTAFTSTMFRNFLSEQQ
jgi:transposase InsO family protein